MEYIFKKELKLYVFKDDKNNFQEVCLIRFDNNPKSWIDLD